MVANSNRASQSSLELKRGKRLVKKARRIIPADQMSTAERGNKKKSKNDVQKGRRE